MIFRYVFNEQEEMMKFQIQAPSVVQTLFIIQALTSKYNENN